MPVGRVESLYLHPLSFAEFLLAGGESAALDASRNLERAQPEAVHEHLLALLRTYLLVGGMPAVVAEYLETRSAVRAMRVQTGLVETMRDDFRKYARQSRHAHLDRVFAAAPAMAGRKFVYSPADPDARARDLGEAARLLEKAGVVHRVRATSGAGRPPAANADERYFKLLLLDVGLMQNALGAAESLLSGDPLRVDAGAVAEQFVGQELLAAAPPRHRPELFYWARREKNSAAEVDYLLAAGGGVVPVEVKSGKTGRLRSLHSFVSRYRPASAVRVYAGPFRRDGGIVSVPLYGLESLPGFLEREVASAAPGCPAGRRPFRGRSIPRGDLFLRRGRCVVSRRPPECFRIRGRGQGIVLGNRHRFDAAVLPPDDGARRLGGQAQRAFSGPLHGGVHPGERRELLAEAPVVVFRLGHTRAAGAQPQPGTLRGVVFDPEVHERSIGAVEVSSAAFVSAPNVGFGHRVTALRDPVTHAGDREIGVGEAEVTEVDSIPPSPPCRDQSGVGSAGESRLEGEVLAPPRAFPEAPHHEPPGGERGAFRGLRAKVGGDHIRVQEGRPRRLLRKVFAGEGGLPGAVRSGDDGDPGHGRGGAAGANRKATPALRSDRRRRGAASLPRPGRPSGRRRLRAA